MLTAPAAERSPRSRRLRGLGTRWLGVGLAAVISVVTLVLGVTGRLTLYISPETVWFACAAAVVTLIGAVWSCTLPLGTEDDHGHDHGQAHDHGHDAAEAGAGHRRGPVRRAAGTAAVVTGGVLATGVAAGALFLPPASLSVDLAMSRAPGSDVLFAGADTVTLGAATDTSVFGIGDWASVFATAARPETYDGAEVTLTGFLTPAGDEGDEARLTRMVITHCVIDAQPAAVPVQIDAWQSDYAVGDWVEVTGTVRALEDGTLRVEPSGVTRVDEPGDPYEH
ncbi:TIGR03943 family putative permease subunit [Microbacterium resistens]|uniref:TIGR03943 family putative permease subunit n=1 Tax=Microbacterium resistens TaxID=156977 RepID=UPI0027E35474|nr:TIGR03943 family protein [Microbacterium resistens]